MISVSPKPAIIHAWQESQHKANSQQANNLSNHVSIPRLLMHMFGKFDLRFDVKADEEAFKANIEPRIGLLSAIGWALTALGMIVYFSQDYLATKANKGNPFKWDSDDPRTIVFATYAATFVYFAFNGLFCSLHWWHERFRFFDAERLCIWNVTVLMLVWPFINKFHVAKRNGVSPESLWGYDVRDSDLSHMLDILALVTVLCNLVPVRSSNSWVMHVVASAVVLSKGFLGTPFPKVFPMNCFCTLNTLAYSLVGAYWKEVALRGKWLAARRLEQSMELVMEKDIEIQDTSALVNAMQAIATTLCDVVIKLSEDLHALDVEHAHKELFGVDLKGRRFAEVLAVGDRSHFINFVDQAATSGIPQFLSVTLLQRCGPVRGNLLIVSTGMSRVYCLVGVRIWEEALPPSTGPSQVKGAQFPRSPHELEDGSIGSIADSAGYSAEADGSEAVMSLSPQEKRERFKRPSSISQSMSSGATTTNTGCLFSNLRKHSQMWPFHHDLAEMSVHRDLEHIVNLGEEEHWLINAEDLRFPQKRILGVGGFGLVLAATFHGTQVAVKVTKIANDNDVYYKKLPPICDELQILRRVRHPNIVMLFGACIDPISAEIALVLEQVQGQSLDDFVCKSASPDVFYCHSILLDVCSALRYLHAQKPCIVHGDLKSTNTFVEVLNASTIRAKLLDFGLSRLLTKHALPLGGTRGWMAPELRSNTRRRMRPSPASDVYSFGHVVLFVVTGLWPNAESPSSAVEPCDVVAHMAENDNLPAEISALSQACSVVSKACLQEDPKARPDTAQIHDMVLAWPLCLGVIRNERPVSEYAMSLQEALRRSREQIKGADADLHMKPSGPDPSELAPERVHCVMELPSVH